MQKMALGSDANNCHIYFVIYHNISLSPPNIYIHSCAWEIGHTTEAGHGKKLVGIAVDGQDVEYLITEFLKKGIVL